MKCHVLLFIISHIDHKYLFTCATCFKPRDTFENVFYRPLLLPAFQPLKKHAAFLQA